MITDPVGDLLTRIRNAAKSRNKEVTAPYSKLKYAVSLVLQKEGYLSDAKKQGNELLLTLTYKRRQSLLTGIRNVSRPGMRIYRRVNRLPRPLGGAGISIVSTSKGVMSNKEAGKKRLGGEVLGEIW